MTFLCFKSENFKCNLRRVEILKRCEIKPKVKNFGLKFSKSVNNKLNDLKKLFTF